MSITSPWLFTVDYFTKCLQFCPTFKYAVVAVDYFTKWVEAKPLTVISSKKVQEFVWESIICPLESPHEIVLDNGTQFDSNKFRTLYDNFGIKKRFSSVDHP